MIIPTKRPNMQFCDDDYYMTLIGIALGHDNPNVDVSTLKTFEDIDYLIQQTYGIEIPIGTPRSEAYSMITSARSHTEDPFRDRS